MREEWDGWMKKTDLLSCLLALSLLAFFGMTSALGHGLFCIAAAIRDSLRGRIIGERFKDRRFFFSMKGNTK